MPEIDINDLIPTFEAVIDRVEHGKRVTVTVGGERRAMLVPFDTAESGDRGVAD